MLPRYIIFLGVDENRWGVIHRYDLGRITQRKSCAHAARKFYVREDATGPGAAVDLEQKVPAVGNLVLIFEDVEHWSFGESNPMSFDGFTADEFRRGPKKGYSDHRVGILRVESVNADQIGGARDEENVDVVWGLTDDNVICLEPVGNADGERGPIHAGTFDGVDSGVLTSRQ